jgi:hypothetical protein
LPNLVERIDWDPLLADVSYAVHLAGIAHQGTTMSEATYDRITHVANRLGADPRVRLIEVGALTVPAARNLGMAAAQGRMHFFDFGSKACDSGAQAPA